MSNLKNDSVKQLKRALAIREKMDVLQAELNELLGGEIPVPFSVSPKKRKMSASARQKIGEAQKLRWARFKDARGVKPEKRGRRKMTAATRAKMAAAARVRWAKAKASGKTTL